MILKGLKKDVCFEPLRGDDRFQDLVSGLAESLEEMR